MDTDSLPHRGTAWRTSRGCLGIWLPATSIMVAALQGHGDASLALPMVSAYKRLPSDESLHLFFDLQRLESYEARLPARMASQLFPDRKRVRVDVLVASPKATMGFGIVGTTVGAAFEAMTSRNEFRRHLYLRLAEHGVVGFSLDALESLSNQ